MAVETQDPRGQVLDVGGEHEFALLLGLTMREFRKLRSTDPHMPVGTPLVRGPVWSGEAMRAFDTRRRRMGVYRREVQ